MKIAWFSQSKDKGLLGKHEKTLIEKLSAYWRIDLWLAWHRGDISLNSDTYYYEPNDYLAWRLSDYDLAIYNLDLPASQPMIKASQQVPGLLVLRDDTKIEDLRALGIIFPNTDLAEQVKQRYCGPIFVLAKQPADQEEKTIEEYCQKYREAAETVLSFKPYINLIDRVGQELSVISADKGGPVIDDIAGHIHDLIG